MHDIERLRAIARAGEVEPTELAFEAAYALAGLSRDRRALVQSCRRLLEFHPHVGALWWVCAELIDALEPDRRAIDLVEQLQDDASADGLFALPSARDCVVAESSRQIVRALCDRVDLPVRLVGDGSSLRLGVRLFRDSVAPVEAHRTQESEPAFRDATLVVIEALAASRAGLLVSRTAAQLVELAGARELPVVVLAGVGRILPDALVQAMCALGRDLEQSAAGRAHGVDGDILELSDHGATRESDGAPREPWSGEIRRDARLAVFRDWYLLDPGLATTYVTAHGPRQPAVVFHPSPSVSHLTCPVPDELLTGFMVTRPR